MNIFILDKSDNMWIVESRNIKNDYIPAGTPVIKISSGDEFLFDRKTIQNMINSLSPDILNVFDVSIKKVSNNLWNVRLGKLDSNWKVIK